MRNLYKALILLTYLISWFSTFDTLGQQSPSQTGTRVNISSITSSVNTGHNYSPWLNDNLNDMVQNVWSLGSFIYSDVTLTLASRTDITRLSLYDWQGIFTDAPATIYAQSGTKRTLLGIFTGDSYMNWVDISVSTPVTADAIIIHKYSNNIPQKIQVFGKATTALQVSTPSIISFPSLPTKTIGDAPFNLVATSNNTAVPIIFISSNPAVISVSNATGNWQATVGAAGTATITASQAGSSSYLAAAKVAQPIMVQAAPTRIVTGKIPIDPQRWYQPTNSPDGIRALFDGNTNENVSVGYGQAVDKIDSFYPLLPGETLTLESIKFFDGWGNNVDYPMTLSVITDSWQRIPIATFTGNQYGWVGPYPNRPTTFTLDKAISNARFLVLTSWWAYPTEIELYGSYTAPTPVQTPSASTLATKKQIKLKQSLGVNAFEWDLEDPNQPWEVETTRLNAVKNFTGIRHYLDWEKLESTQGSYTFNPVHSGGWNYDAMYESLQREGIEVLTCLKTLPGWMLRTYPAAERDAENVPVLFGRDFTNPTSYIEQAKVAFQFVARYGNNPNVNRNLLSVNSTPRWTADGINQVRVGLNYVKYIECDNERDKWWKGRKAYQTPFEYAANLSAFYDGHKNTMGLGVGVKNADPSMQVVMGGLAAPSPDYVKAMIDWCRQYRGYKENGSVNLCWDIINYHHYSNNAGTSQGGNSTRGAAPEVSDAEQIAKAFVLMAHQYAGGMPVWMTESGYDLNQGSPLKAVATGTRSVQETQADWTLRMALAYARWGVERVFLYQLYDDNPTNPIQFGSMGLIDSKRTPRPAAQYLSQANKLIGNYTYKQTLHGDPIVDRYELNGQSAYVLVVPDERGRTAPYTLNLGSVAYADVYRPTIGSANMTSQRISLQNGQLNIQVSETPVFVLPVYTTVSPTTACMASGTILREEWSNIGGSSITAIPLQNTPTSTRQLTQFESIANIGDNYGARIRGYLCPPQSGAYTFWIAGDDTAELWLSTDDSPANKIRIASVQSWTNPREWTKATAQQSFPVTLVAGKRYYVEVLHKEQGGGDHVAVAWKLPNGTMEGPIPSSRLSPYLGIAARSANNLVAGNITKTALTSLSDALNKAVKLTAVPNPFTEESYIQFELAVAGKVTLSIYNMQGRLVRQLFAGTLEAGKPQGIVLKTNGLASGIYSIRLTTETQVIHERVILNK